MIGQMNIKNHQAGDKQQWFLFISGIYTQIHGCNLIIRVSEDLSGQLKH